jgi:lactobin A/cerein 7B family class IIb bacteriocin
MSTFSINDLQAGSDLISDQETYLNELTDEDLQTINGGTIPAVITTLVAFGSGTAAGYHGFLFIKSFFSNRES